MQIHNEKLDRASLDFGFLGGQFCVFKGAKELVSFHSSKRLARRRDTWSHECF